MELIQILAVIFAAAALAATIMKLKDGKMALKGFAFWSTIWTLVMAFAVVPGAFGLLSSLLGIQRPVDAVIYLGLILLFYMIFKLNMRMEGMEQEITKAVREVALRRKR